MDAQKIPSRSKSSSLIISINSLYQKAHNSLTPSSRKTPTIVVSIPHTTKAKSPQKKINFIQKTKTAKSRYLPSSMKSSPKIFNLREFSKEKVAKSSGKLLEIPPKKWSPPQSIKNLFRDSPFSKIIPKKNLIIKVKKPSSIDDDLYENCVIQASYRTKIGQVLGKNKSNNQDNCFIMKNFADSKSQHFFGVMDGHGLFGHEVSLFIKRRLPILIEKSLPEESNIYIAKNPILSVGGLSKLRSIFDKSFTSIHNFLAKRKIIDVNYSGTTLNTVYIHGKTCICSNVGDSRAIIGRFSKR